MKRYSIFSEEFCEYGQVLEGYDFGELVDVLKKLPQPEEGFVYKASEEKLEKLKVYEELKNRAFGGMDMQLGYCNGRNTKLNCLEYHKNSELCIMACDTILFLGLESQIRNGRFHLSLCKAFYVPKGYGVELYATTLHYCPCHVSKEEGFLVANGLLRGTNDAIPDIKILSQEDRFLAGKNKWLLAHEDAPEVKDGAVVALYGKNADSSEDVYA